MSMTNDEYIKLYNTARACSIDAIDASSDDLYAESDIMPHDVYIDIPLYTSFAKCAAHFGHAQAIYSHNIARIFVTHYQSSIMNIVFAKCFASHLNKHNIITQIVVYNGHKATKIRG